MKRSVIIVAGGNGTRMRSELPKQFIMLENLPLLMWTVLCFVEFDAKMSIIVVLPESQINYWKDLCIKYNFNHPHTIAPGGETRFHSVKRGLSYVKNSNLVAVHDGVRPLVSHATIKSCFEQATKSGAAIPVLPMNETLRVGTLDNSQTVDRANYYTVQTPQIFLLKVLTEAYNQSWNPAFTDDASVVESTGIPVTMVLGNHENIKVTHPADLLIAGEFLRNKKDIS